MVSIVIGHITAWSSTFAFLSYDLPGEPGSADGRSRMFSDLRREHSNARPFNQRQQRVLVNVEPDTNREEWCVQ